MAVFEERKQRQRGESRSLFVGFLGAIGELILAFYIKMF